jgi:hypothetical protein
MSEIIDFRTKTAGQKTKYGMITECPVCWKPAAMSQPKPSNGLTLYAHELIVKPREGVNYKVTSFHLVDAQDMPVLLTKEELDPARPPQHNTTYVATYDNVIQSGPTTQRKEVRAMSKKVTAKKKATNSDSGLQTIRDLMTKAAAKVKTDKKGAIALFKKVASQKNFPRKAFRAREALQKLGVTVTA